MPCWTTGKGRTAGRTSAAGAGRRNSAERFSRREPVSALGRELSSPATRERDGWNPPRFVGLCGEGGTAMKTAVSTLACVVTALGLAEPSVAKPGTCPAPRLVTEAQVERYIVQSEEAWAKSVASNDAAV